MTDETGSRALFGDNYRGGSPKPGRQRRCVLLRAACEIKPPGGNAVPAPPDTGCLVQCRYPKQGCPEPEFDAQVSGAWALGNARLNVGGGMSPDIAAGLIPPQPERPALAVRQKDYDDIGQRSRLP